MSLKIQPDYYPVFMDLKEMVDQCAGEQVLVMASPISASNQGSPMLTGDKLMDTSLQYGFSSFQTFILLVKNAFEGDVYLNHQIKPDQLFKMGTLLFQAKPEQLIANFYGRFSDYREGLQQIWKKFSEKQPEMASIDFGVLVHCVLVNHLIRFPVSIFSAFDISLFTSEVDNSYLFKNQRFNVVILGERILGEYNFVERVNLAYSEKFKEFCQDYLLKEEAFAYYQRRLSFAISPNITTEKELDELMYKNVIKEKLKSSRLKNVTGSFYQYPHGEKTFGMVRIRYKTKTIYWLISKNCMEVHASRENDFPELNQIFLKANSYYHETAQTLGQTLLQHMQMLSLLARVLVFRKTNGLQMVDHSQLLSDSTGKEVWIFKDDIHSLHKELDEQLMLLRLNNQTEYKMKFVMDDEFTEIHKHFLQKQLDFMDEQIDKIQKDIRKILQIKAEGSSKNPGKTEEE